MQSIQTMPPMSMASEDDDSCNADRPIFKKVLEGLIDAISSTKKKSIESSLAKELNQLSLAEREEVNYDLHGVAYLIEETPEFVDKCLADLESEICKIEDNKNAYEMAKKANFEYICGRDFRLKFLRAERFLPKNAATRLVGFLEEKLKLFGPEPLARELLLSDLNQDDMVLLRSGFCSIVPLRDSAGRVVTVVIPFFRGESTLEMRVRTNGEFRDDLNILNMISGSPFLMHNLLTNRCALQCTFFPYSPRMKKRKGRAVWGFLSIGTLFDGQWSEHMPLTLQI
jgi:hypothetical protein